MDDRKGKHQVIVLTSDDDDDDDDDEEEEDVDDDDDDDGDDDPDEEEEEEDDDDRYSDTEDEASESDDSDNNDDESLSNKVVALLRGGNDIESLKLNECKAYLRKHGLRVGGTRAVCVNRISEHWRLKDGNGYSLYPRSSFFINCTGDVCKGDVVLFRQKVYEKFDKMTRHGRVIGNRTIAGRVVKESYGAAKQQHTFTVEVLWSSGAKKLAPLFPLLVKGRNLYKQKTYRQRWKNEADRVKVLSEKHRRGAAARFVRAGKQRKKSHHANVSKGSKRQHEIQNTKRPKVGRSCEHDKARHPGGYGRTNNFQPQDATSLAHATWKQHTPSRAFRPSREWQKSAEFDHHQLPFNPSYSYQQRPYQSHVNSQSRYAPSEFLYHERGPIPNMVGFRPCRPSVDEFTYTSRPLVSRDHHRATTNLRYNYDMNNLNAENVDAPLQLSGRTVYGFRKYGL